MGSSRPAWGGGEVKFDDMNDALAYASASFDQHVLKESPFRKYLEWSYETPTTFAILAREALERLKPCRRGRWVRNELGRIKMEQKQPTYVNDLPDVGAVWVYYESAGGGSGRELIKLSVEERGGEFVLEARRW
jgi:hypothetical protein